MWRENDFGENLPADFVDTLGVQNFVEITLARSVSEINTFLCFTQKFKMATKSDGKMSFLKTSSRLCRYAADQKFRRNHSSSLRFR